MYDTQLTPDQELEFQNWRANQVKQGNILPQDTGQDYDFRGAYKQGIQGQMIPSHGEVHWLDTFKKPNHPSFSTESIYATGQNRQYAGQWQNPNTPQERFIPPRVRYPQEQLLNMIQTMFNV